MYKIIIKQLRYTWPILLGCSFLFALYLFKYSIGDSVILYGMVTLMVTPILVAAVQGRNGLIYAVIGLILGVICGLAISSYVGEALSEMIYKPLIQEEQIRADLIIWDFLFSSIMASCLTVFGGWIGRNTTLTDMALSTLGTVIAMTSLFLLSDYSPFHMLGFFIGMYLLLKGQAGVRKKYPYLFSHPWDKQ